MFYKAPNTYIQEGTQFTIDGVTYPSSWLNHATPEQKSALGLEEVVAINSPYNPVYYWTGETLDGATLTYTGTAKPNATIASACAGETAIPQAVAIATKPRHVDASLPRAKISSFIMFFLFENLAKLNHQ